MRKRCRFNQKIYKRGPCWCFRIIDSFGRRPEIRSATRQEAQMKLLDMTKQIVSGISGSSSYVVTIEQGIAFWLKCKSGSIDESSYQRYENHMKNFRTFLATEYPQLTYIAEIKTDHINGFMDSRLQDGRSTKTAKLERNSVYNLFVTLIDHKKIPDFNPVAKSKKIKVQSVQKRRSLSDDELSKIFEQAQKENKGIYWYAIFLTLYIGGLRRDEVRKMEKGSVDLKNNLIKIPDTKTDTPRCIPIHPQLRPVLQEALAIAKGNLVFPNAKGQMLPKNAMRDKLIQICKRAGILQATIHDFRHTFASQPGLSEDSKQRIGGWSTKRVMQETYMHPQENHIRDEYCSVDFLPRPEINATVLPQNGVANA